MTIKKRILTVAIAVTFLAGTMTAGANAASTGASVPNSEFQLALSSGIVPAAMKSNYTKPATEKELYTLLGNVIRVKTGKSNAGWNSKILSAKAKTVNRERTAGIIYQAALLMGTNIQKMYPTNALYFDSNKLDKKFVQSFIEQFHPESNITQIGYVSVARTLKEWQQYDKNLNEDALEFVTGQSDGVSGKKIMELTQDYRFRPMDSTTKTEAILAAYRLYNAIDEKPQYVTLANVGPNTIPAALLSQKSALPDASNSRLPQWKGVGITNKAAAAPGALFSNEDRNFHESEIKFLSENGFNFVRVFFSFSTLGYPDYPKGMVNTVELRELDKLIEWGIKYNVHICLCMEGQPELGKASLQAEIMTGDFFANTKKQELAKEYWQMLSKRYANIPNRNLSFNLMNEPEPPSDEVQTAVFKPIVDAIWKECPGRLVIADCTSASCEGMAKMGVALSYHFYSPNILCYNGLDFMNEAFPYLQTPQWPMTYLPGSFDSGAERNSVVINGNFTKGSIGIYVYDISDNCSNTLSISADDSIVFSQKIDGKKQPESNTDLVQKEFTVELPKGAKKLEIKVDGWLRYGRIQIKQQGKKDINMYPHDLWETDWQAISPVVLVHDDGTYENDNSPKQLVDWDYLYQKVIKEHQDMAQKYNVGFMIGEFGPFGKPLPKNTLINYMNTVLGGLNSSGLPWCNGGFIGDGYIASFLPYSGDYTFTKLPDSDLYINKDLLSMYKKYTKQ